MKDKFIVENYLCSSEKVTEKMNEHYKNGYYPKEIKLGIYQNHVEGLIVYELK